MTAQTLWYVRREGKLIGPHPRKVIVDCLLLGRFAWDDPASMDGRNWQPLKLYPEILAALEPSARAALAESDEPSSISWHNERLAAAKRWADERSGLDRRTGDEVESAEERRSLDERRQQRELLQVVLWRRLRRELSAAYDRSGASRGWLLPAIAAAVVVVVAVAIATWQRAPSSIEVSLGSLAANCAAAPAPGVSWAGCNRQGAALGGVNLRAARLSGVKFAEADLRNADLTYAELAGADLSGARLSGARLFGANLSGANLSGASMESADLSFADLRNAKLEAVQLTRARLGNAIWTDGRRCASTSIGRCD